MLANADLHMLASWKAEEKEKKKKKRYRYILHQQQGSKCGTESQPQPPSTILVKEKQ